MAHPIHFVGSLGMPDAETAFRTLAEKVGDLAKRYPDGEPGARSIWIRYQIDMLEAHPRIELVKRVEMQAGGEMFNRPYYRPVEGEDLPGFDFGALGYAAEAEDSYAIFEKLRSDGVIPAGTRFQVCLPTPAAVVQGFIDPEVQAAVEPAYDKAMRAELANIVSAIPNDDLSIQWDIASEVIAVEGGRDLYYDDFFDGTVKRVCKLSDLVPEPAELGIHLCYGDPGHKHVIEPPDLSVCVRFANALTAGISRSVQWMHMPVPRDRDDDAYFAPLANLDMTPGTELILGLVHHTGGIDATLSRLATARRHAVEFGIATECGFGRRKPETLPELFDIHVAAAGS